MNDRAQQTAPGASAARAASAASAASAADVDSAASAADVASAASAASPASAAGAAADGERRPLDIRTTALVVIALVALLHALQWAKAIVAPILLGIMLSYALTPVVHQLRRWRVPHAAGAALVLAAIAGLAGWGAWSLSDEAEALLETLPQVTQKIRQLAQTERGEASALRRMEQAAADLQAVAYGSGGTPGGPGGRAGAAGSGAPAAAPAAPAVTATPAAPAAAAASTTGTGAAAGAARPSPVGRNAPALSAVPDVNIRDYLLSGTLGAFAVLAQLAVVFFVALFLMASGVSFRRKLVRLAGPQLSRKKVTLQTLDEITAQIQRYLLVQVGTSAVVGIGTWLAFYALGMQQSAVWGVVAGITNLVPYFGAALMGAGSAAVALLQFGTLNMVVAVSAASFIVHALVGNLLAPWWMGRASGMSPVVVFIVVLVFGWLWGVWGLLLGVPILMAVKAVCDRVDGLKGLGEFLGS